MACEFRVVGVSLVLCREQAERKLRKLPFKEQPKTPEAWRERREAEARALFDAAQRGGKLAEYDSPAAAMAFADLAAKQPDQFRGVMIERYHKTESVNPKTGKRIGYWEAFDAAEIAAQRTPL